MGPGSRHDTLEDHFQWSNFEKLVQLGDLSFFVHHGLLGMVIFDL